MAAITILRRVPSPTSFIAPLSATQVNGHKFLSAPKIGLSVLIVAVAALIIVRLGVILGRFTFNLCKSLVHRIRQVFSSNELKVSRVNPIIEKGVPIGKPLVDQNEPAKENSSKEVPHPDVQTPKGKVTSQDQSELSDDSSVCTPLSAPRSEVSRESGSPDFRSVTPLSPIPQRKHLRRSIPSLMAENWLTRRPIPQNLKSFGNEPCPIYSGKKVKDTFSIVPLFHLGQDSDGSSFPLTLNFISALDKRSGGPGCEGLDTIVNDQCTLGQFEFENPKAAFVLLRKNVITGDDAIIFNEKLSELGWKELAPLPTIMAILWKHRQNSDRFAPLQPLWDERCWYFPKNSSIESSKKSEGEEDGLKTIVMHSFKEDGGGLCITVK